MNLIRNAADIDHLEELVERQNVRALRQLKVTIGLREERIKRHRDPKPGPNLLSDIIAPGADVNDVLAKTWFRGYSLCPQAVRGTLGKF